MRKSKEAEFTNKFNVGQRVRLNVKEDWEADNGMVIFVNPDKPNHHYQVQIGETEWAKFWFNESELEGVEQ